ncbi:putative ribonuclease H-like domain-containing protein [Tanacetum coccineum]
MTAIFHELIEDSMEVFMDDLSVFGNSFEHCLKNLEKMLKRCEETNLVLKRENCHFMLKEGIVLDHKVSSAGIEEVILNGNKVLKRTVGEVEQEYKPTSAEEKQDMRNEMKARGTLLMALPNKDQLKFHSYKDAKLLMEAIKKRLQKLISQLEIQGEVITQEDMNFKLLRSLPSEWKTYALIWRNKQEIETISLDGFTNSNNNSSTTEADNTTYEVSAAHTQSNPTSGDNLSDAVICAFLARVVFDRSKVECYNCHKNGHFARECRAPRNQENRGRENSRRTMTVETPTENALVAQDGIGGYDWSYQAEEEHPTNYALMAYTSLGNSSNSDSKVDSCSKSHVKAYATLKEQYDSLTSDYKKSQFNLVSYKAGLESVESRLAHYKKNEAVFEESINVLNLEVKLRDNALVENKKKLEKAEKERDELKLTLEKFQNSSKSLNNLLESQVCDKFKIGLGYNAASPVVESFVNSSKMLENQEYYKSKSDKGYHAVPPPYTGNLILFKPDLMFIDEIVKSENMDVITVVTPSNVKKVESNHESADVKNNGDAVEPKTVRKNSFRPPVIEDWNSDDDSEVEFIPNVKDKTVRPSTEKIKFVKSARETVEKVETPKQNKHYPRGNQRNWNNLMSQRLGSDFKMINKACFICGSFEHLHYVYDKKVIRPVWNNSSRVNHKNFSNKMTHPHPNRRFVPQAVLTRSGKINTAGASVNTAGSKTTVNHPRPISNAYKKGYSQVTKKFNKYLANKNSIFNKKVNTVRIQVYNGLDPQKSLILLFYVHGNPQQKEYWEKGVIDSGCSKHMTGNKCYLTEYEDYDGGFVSFGDGKGRISGKGKIKTGTLDFDNVLLDESQVLLRVPRKDNIYSVDLKSVIPTKGLTCLFAKATIDESNLWHRRLGHINFKNINKIVRGNLVRGLTSKIFENDHSCVACQKGKQHKASYKAKLVNSISKPLHMLNMDLFGPTNVKSLMKKSYCLVVTGEFSRFSWVFVLATKDETSGILKTFTTEIENQLDYKVKVIRSDNGTEFKNSVMNQLCEMKGIKREFSVARTPQQNGVAERRNRTLIKAARTMDHLGTFDGKADDGFFVGHSVVSKAIRVFNKRTRIVEETLNIRFLENAPNVTGNGPNWLFDVDSLIKSMNYVLVVAGNQTNGIVGTRDNIIAGQDEKKTEPEQEYILIPIYTTDPLISQGPKNSEEDVGVKPTEVDESEALDKDGKDE